jgi:hypothetical protein
VQIHHDHEAHSPSRRMLQRMSGDGPLEPAPGSPEARRRAGAGTWVGYLMFALFLLFLIIFDAHAVYQREWANVAGITVFTLIYLIVPTGGARWLRRALRDRKSPEPPDGRVA